MPLDFAALLRDYGLETEENSSEVSTAFFHEIHNTIGENPLFSSTHIDMYPSAGDYLVDCQLICRPGTLLESSVESLVDQWERELRYKNSRLNVVEVANEETHTEVRCLSISSSECGVSCRFRLHQPELWLVPTDGLVD